MPFGASRSLSDLKSARANASMHSIAFDIFPETSKLRSLCKVGIVYKILKKVLERQVFKCADKMVSYLLRSAEKMTSWVGIMIQMMGS